MSRRFLAGATALACAACLLACTLVRLGAADANEATDKDLFGATRESAVHLVVPAKEYEPMQPPAGGFGFPGAPPAPPAPAPGEKRDSERNLFGTEFRWAQGDFSAEG